MYPTLYLDAYCHAAARQLQDVKGQEASPDKDYRLLYQVKCSDFSLPDAEGSRNMPVVFTADGSTSATNAAASLDAASLSNRALCIDRPDDRIASSLSAQTVWASSEEGELGTIVLQEGSDAGHDCAATGQAVTAVVQDEVWLDTDPQGLQNVFCCHITKDHHNHRTNLGVRLICKAACGSQRFAAALRMFAACHQALTQSTRS